MKKQIFKAVIAGIISPVILIMLFLFIPIYSITFIIHMLDDDSDESIIEFIDHTNAYISEWKYIINLYIRIFTFKKN